jgi:DedD protein
MKDHNLDDLIISDNEPQGNRSKKLLTIIAILIAMLIVAIVMTRMILGNGDANQTIQEPKQEELISPELKLDTTDQNLDGAKKELDQLSNIIEDESNMTVAPKQTIAAPIKEIAPKTIEIDEENGVSALTPQSETPSPKPTENALKMPEATQQTPIDSMTEERNTPTQAQGIDTVKKETSQAEESGNKRDFAEEPAVQKEIPNTKPIANKPQSDGAYYIQVGSFTQEPSAQFLSVITKSGFAYKLSNGKLLIGPYGSKEDANRDLGKVKDRINKQSFIKKL